MTAASATPARGRDATLAAPRVEILHVPACPNLGELRTRVRHALARRGLDLTIEEIEEIEGARASPTLLIDGIEVTGDPPPGGLACRLELPSEDEIAAALSPIDHPARHLRRAARRVLKPGGRLHFVELGLSPHARVALLQRRLPPLWRHVAGGCHLDRPIDELVAGAGLEITALDRYRFSWPEAFTYF